MKKTCLIFSFLLFLISFSFAQQDVVVNGTVNYPDGTPASGVEVEIFTDFCGNDSTNVYIGTVLTNPNGYFTDTIPASCVSTNIWAVALCSNGILTTGVGTYDPSTLSVNINLVCEGSNTGCDDTYFVYEQQGTVLAFYTPTSNPGNTNTYYWDFGDNTSSGEANPVHTYPGPGEYLVCLFTTDANGNQCEYCEPVYITNTSGCDASFVTEQDTSLPGIYFLANSTTPDSLTYIWDMGDGNTMEGAGFYYEYEVPGVYEVCMVAFSANGDACTYCDIVISEGAQNCQVVIDVDQEPNSPYYEFSADIYGGTPPYTYLWDLGDNTYSQVESPVHTYDFSGWYFVCVTVTDANGYACENCYQVFVDNGGGSNCQVFFEAGPVGSSADWYFQAFSNSNVPYEYFWDLGDGTSMYGETFFYQYAESGEYYVCVTAVTPDSTTCSTCDWIYFQGQGEYCQSWIAYEVDDSTNLVSFEAMVEGGTGPYSYFWEFGDNTFSTEQNPEHIYTSFGLTACLTVTDANGISCTYCEWINIGGGGEDCLDWSLIELGAVCPGYHPVCGCDGITYENACIAERCFGVTEWTDGPCPNDNNNGGGTNPTDSTGICVADFLYFGGDSSGTFYYVFIPTSDALSYYWEFGDGTTSDSFIGFHEFVLNNTDSVASFTVCLTVSGIGPNGLDCVDTACETIVLDQDPEGEIGGGLTESDNFSGDGGVVTRGSSGDPIAGATIRLLGPEGSELARTETDNSGSYSFQGLQFGNYQVHVDLEDTQHEPFPVKITPVVQTIEALDFVLNDAQVLTGTAEIEGLEDVRVYPNPVSSTLNISFELVQSSRIEVSLNNMLGQKVESRMGDFGMGEQFVSMDIEGLLPGIYWLTLRSEGQIYSHKIVKQ